MAAAVILAARLIATLIDIGGMLAVACGLAIALHALDFVRAGLVAPPAAQPWLDLVKLGRKRRLRPEFASPLYPVWPVVALAATIAAVIAVPGFADDLITAPLGTLPVLIGLLAAGRAARILAALESGEGRRGLAGAGTARDALIAETIWLVALGALALAHGDLTLTGIGGLAPPPVRAVFILAIPAVLLGACGWREVVPGDYAGIERGLFVIETMLRRVVLLAALLDVAVPGFLADGRLALSWPVGLIVWIVEMAVAGIGLAMISWLVPRGAALRLGMILALAALLIALTQTVAPDTLPLVIGLLAVVAGFALLLGRRLAVPEGLGLMQIGVALIGFSAGAMNGAMLILAVLVLVRLASLLTGHSWVAALGVIAAAGLPPFGVFAGDFAILGHVFAAMPTLGVVLCVGLIVAAVVAVARLRLVGGPRVSPAGIAAGLLLAIAALLGVAPGLIGLLR